MSVGCMATEKFVSKVHEETHGNTNNGAPSLGA